MKTTLNLFNLLLMRLLLLLLLVMMMPKSRKIRNRKHRPR